MVRAGGVIRSLCHFEVKVIPGEPLEGRVRGESWEESEELIDAVKAVLLQPSRPDGSLYEFFVSLEVPAEIAADPDFWPRILLRPDGKLMIRARTVEESANLALALRHIMMAWIPRDRKNWMSVQIDKGAFHSVILEFKPQEVRRVVAKIAYGLVRFFGGSLSPAEDESIRNYILVGTTDASEPVEEEVRPGTITSEGLTHHCVLLGDLSDPGATTVTLYTLTYKVNFKTVTGLPSTPTVVLCRFDGKEMRVADSGETANILVDHFWRLHPVTA